MPDLSPLALGIIFVAMAVGIIVIVFSLLRLIPRLHALTKVPPPPPASLSIDHHNEAVLLVQRGGRVTYINQQARELFNLWEEEPNLESLARKTRPSETFLTLCATEGQARFSLNGRFVEGTSYFASSAPSNNGANQLGAILISLRRPQLMVESETRMAGKSSAGEQPTTASGQTEVTRQAFTVFTELSQTIASNLDLEAALKAILESVERLIPSDFFEITIQDPDSDLLVPYRLIGLAGVDRHLERGAERYRSDQGYTGYLITHREHLLVKDINVFRDARPALDRQRYPFQSYLGIPMLVGGKLVGTLELASLSKDNYSDNDLEILNLLSGQASTALNNALLYQQEQKRANELAGLANLAQAVSAIRDPQDLYARLIESITPLIKVEAIGFLVYDETRHLLEGQIPFQGIQSNVIELSNAYTFIQPGSPAETIWQNAESIISTNAPEDSRIQALNLNHLAQAAGMHHTVLMPLTTGGRMLGYLMVANKRDGTPFDRDEMRLMAIIAGQAGPIIENATLVQQSRRRAQRAETLRRIASLTSSSATLEEILKFSILDLARLLQADTAALFLLDESRGELRLHRSSLYGVSPELASHLNRIPIDDPQFKTTATGSKSQFFSADLGEEPTIPPLYQPLVSELKVRSAIDVPLISRERGIGELMVGSFRANFFSRGDLQTVATASGQLAGAIEQSALSSQTDQSLRQRVEQLTALTRVSRELNTTLVLPNLLQRVFEEALRTTSADCGTILLFDLRLFELNEISDATKSTAARDGQTKNPNILLHFGDTPGTELHPLEQMVLEQGESLIVDDFQAPVMPISRPEMAESFETIEPANIVATEMQPAHSGVRSALVVPIGFQGQIAGLIHLHARKPEHFKESEREIVEVLAVQAAIALGNAQRYHEQLHRSGLLNRRVETLSKLFEVSQVLQADQPLDQALEAIAYAIQESTPFEIVLISIYDPQTQMLQRLAGTGIPLATMAELRARSQPWSAVQRLLDPQFKIGRSYFIPHERAPVTPADLHMVTLGEGEPIEAGQSWHPEDLLTLPLLDNNGNPLGLISVDSPRNNLRPDRPTIETLEIFGSQAALMIESQYKVRELRSRVKGMDEELSFAKETAQKAQSHLPTLLHKDLEQTLAIQHLSQRTQRINAGLDIIELVNKQATRSDVLLALGNEILIQMDFDLALVAERAPAGIRLMHTLGAVPAGVNPKALLGQRNPLRQGLQNSERLLVADLDNNTDWQNTPLLRALEAKSFICLPIGKSDAAQADDDQNSVLAAVLAVSRTQLAPFTTDDEQLFDLLSRQVAVALNNLNLLDETTRRLREVNLLLEFSRQLGGLDPTSILKTLVDSALRVVPGAQAATVALWDPKQGQLLPRVAIGYANNEGLLDVLYRPGEGLPGQVFEQRRAVRLDEVDFAKHYNLRPENLLRYRDATGGHLPVASLAVPIMSGLLQDIGTTESANGSASHSERARAVPLGVLVLDNSQTTNIFTDDDLALVTSLAQQTALTLENARLYQGAEQRSRQLSVLTDVATTITSNLRSEDLIATLLDQLQAIMPYDTGTLWLRSRENTRFGGQSKVDRLVIQAARGFEDSDQRIGITVDVQDSVLLNEMINTGKAIWVPDILQDARFRPASLLEAEGVEAPTGYERLSWLGVPLIASGQVIGVIALEKSEANFYTPDDVQMAATFAGQAAVGLENAKLYQESVQRAQELDQRSQTLTILNRLSSELSSRLEVDQILNASLSEFIQVVPCSSVSVLLYEMDAESEKTPRDDPEIAVSQGSFTLQAEYSLTGVNKRSSIKPGMVLPYTPLLDRLRETQGIFSTDNISQENELEPLHDFLARYHTRSLLIVPIASGGTATNEITPEHRFFGVLLAHNDESYHYHSEEFDLSRTISNQMAIALQNAHLFEETRSLTEELEMRVQQRTAELMREQQRVETLLRIITELSASLDLDQVLNRTLRVLNEYVDAEQITILITRLGEKKLYRLASLGYPSESLNTSSSSGLGVDEGLAGWIISQRQSVLIHDVQEDERWVTITYGGENPPAELDLLHHAALGVPLMSGAEALGCLLLFHSQSGHFSMDQSDLVQAAANQVAVAVNNAELYRLIRDQAEDLGTMLRSQQIETSRSKAILEAVANGVLVTDASRQITLFNESAEKILGLERSQVLGKSMEQFIGLFGRAAQSWLALIDKWSQDSSAYQSRDTFAEQFTLEDGRVIAVNLAPVSLRNDFLGTVSIFQDITHQVEVDRLKSEFVATVSHELRTPMTSIKGYVEILLMGAAGALSEQQTYFLQVVKTNTERLAVLVNDLLDISQIEAGRVALSFQPINLEEVANGVVAEVERRSQEEGKPITFIKEIPANLPRIFGDPDRIRNILENLVDNGYLYNTPEGKVTVKMQQVGDEIQVDVIDTGLGIHPGDLERVFERFFRGEQPLELGVSGTGLGLSIVKNLVEMHKGRIWATSAGIPGEGSTFSFTLPIYKPEASEG